MWNFSLHKRSETGTGNTGGSAREGENGFIIRQLLRPTSYHDHAQRQEAAEPGAGRKQVNGIGRDMHDRRHALMGLCVTDAGQ